MSPQSFFQIREQATLLETAGKIGRDQDYSSDYDTGAGQHHVDKAMAYAEKKGYKINYGYGHPKHKRNQHKKPDITTHVAMGDDDHHAYTVHHDGAAAHDTKLHIKSIHYGDAE